MHEVDDAENKSVACSKCGADASHKSVGHLYEVICPRCGHVESGTFYPYETVTPSNTSREALIRAAIEARERAYAKYSQFQVGAAVLTGDGRMFSGCNVENSSYGLTICAERAAVFSAVAAGQHKLDMIAIATAGGATPCGACRQVLAEFNPALPILLVDVDHPDRIAETDLRQLLPGAFSFRPKSERR